MQEARRLLHGVHSDLVERSFEWVVALGRSDAPTLGFIVRLALSRLSSELDFVLDSFGVESGLGIASFVSRDDL